MHELGVALDIVEFASDAAARLGAVQIAAVRVRVGALAGVAKEALLFSFDVASAGTAVEGARLTIEDVPVSVWCARCDAECELVDPAVRRCARCHSLAPRVVRGEELQVIGLEIEER